METTFFTDKQEAYVNIINRAIALSSDAKTYIEEKYYIAEHEIVDSVNMITVMNGVLDIILNELTQLGIAFNKPLSMIVQNVDDINFILDVRELLDFNNLLNILSQESKIVERLKMILTDETDDTHSVDLIETLISLLIAACPSSELLQHVLTGLHSLSSDDKFPQYILNVLQGMTTTTSSNINHLEQMKDIRKYQRLYEYNLNTVQPRIPALTDAFKKQWIDNYLRNIINNFIDGSSDFVTILRQEAQQSSYLPEYYILHPSEFTPLTNVKMLCGLLALHKNNGQKTHDYLERVVISNSELEDIGVLMRKTLDWILCHVTHTGFINETN